MAPGRNMNRSPTLCEVHSKEASFFCLCDSSPLFICTTCLTLHEGHETYPEVQFELFQAIGKDKVELKRRNDLWKGVQAFLKTMEEREGEVQSEAKALMNTVHQNYCMWLEGNHRCFQSLLTTLKEDTAKLLNRSRYQTAPITQLLLDQSDVLNSEHSKRMIHAPELETLTYLTGRCLLASSRGSIVWQTEFEEELLEALTAGQWDEVEKETPHAVTKDSALLALNLKLEVAMRQLQAQQTDFQSKSEYCLSLEKERDTVNKVMETLTTQSKHSLVCLEKSLSQTSELEHKLKDLHDTLHYNEGRLQEYKTDYEVERAHHFCAEKEKETLDKLCQAHVSQIERVEKALAEANERSALLQARLVKWGITTESPNESQEPVLDFSTDKSRTALKRFGPYIAQDDELVEVKRGPVIEETGVYIGHWNSRNQKHGYGKFLFKTGDIYEGQWRNGSRTGRGRYIYANGDVFEGDFVENEKEGFGTCYSADGNVYTGNWLAGKQHGFSSWKLNESSQLVRYIGECSNGKCHGLGACWWADGRMYVGPMKDGNCHGKGLLGTSTQEMYQGSDVCGISVVVAIVTLFIAFIFWLLVTGYKK